VVDHHIEAHFKVKADIDTTGKKRDRQIQQRAIGILTDMLVADMTFTDRAEAGKYARAIVVGLSALPQILRQAIDEIDAATL
jgi:hypothetical protein